MRIETCLPSHSHISVDWNAFNGLTVPSDYESDYESNDSDDSESSFREIFLNFQLSSVSSPMASCVVFVGQVPISKLKSNYIPVDCVRIANELGMPFGSIFDVGVDIQIIEICLKMFMFAQHEHKEKEYTLKMATAIWAHGVDVEHTENAKKLLMECGLSWQRYTEYERENITKNEHIAMTERNLAALQETGNWGVPSIQIGDVCVWGQDRLWAFAMS